MSDALDRICRSREEAHAAVTHGYALAKLVLDMGRPVRIRVEAQEDDRSVAQNRFYWGACLSEISEQATVGGQRYTVDAWHELFKRQFLGYEIVKVQVAGRRKNVVIRRLRSTTKLSVSRMSEYLHKVQAFAATELGVRFSAPAEAEYQAVTAKSARRQREEQPA